MRQYKTLVRIFSMGILLILLNMNIEVLYTGS